MIYTYRDFNIEIFEDVYPPSTRFEHDNLGHMVLFGIEGAEDHPFMHFEYQQEDFEILKKRLIKEQKATITLPVYQPMNDKEVSTEPFGHQVGFVYAIRAEILEWFGKLRLSPNLEARVVEVLKSEVKSLSQFRTGDVWGFCITEPDGSHCSASSGFYGLEYTKVEAQDLVDSQWNLIEMDKEKIDSISDRDLPLYVNHKWGCTLSEWYFKKRFRMN